MVTKPKLFILIVEDEKELATLISEQLEARGMMTQVYHRSNNVLRFLKNNFVNLLLLDINLPDINGFSLLENLKNNNIHVDIYQIYMYLYRLLQFLTSYVSLNNLEIKFIDRYL